MPCDQILLDVLKNSLIIRWKLFSVLFQESLNQSDVPNIWMKKQELIHCVVLQTDWELLWGV